MGEEHAPGFFKTSPKQTLKIADSKFLRVAKFLVLIGSEKAAEILSKLPSDQVEAISKEIATVNAVGPEESKAILDEFGTLLSVPYFEKISGASGGIAAARQLLYAAFGAEKGEQLLVKAVPEAKPNPFAFLEDFNGSQLALLFKEESAQAAALVFSRLPPKLSADALTHITSEKKLEILKCIARQKSLSPEVLEQVAGALREKARNIGKKDDDVSFDGMEALAAILKSSSDLGSKILSELAHEDPELSQSLKERIYTLSDILEAEDIVIQKKLATMENRDIILLLKARAGYSDTVAYRKKILSNLSQGRKEIIIDEENIMGLVSRREVEEVATSFLTWFRQGREDGTIVMMSDKDLVM